MSNITPQLEQDAEKAIPGDIRMFSGCADSQTSADVSNMGAFKLPADVGPGGAGGACSGAFASVITSSTGLNSLTWSHLLNGMRTKLIERRFTQIPQLSSSRKLSLDGTFSLVPPGGRARRAVFIGINYVGQQGELRGCHNDADMIQKIVTQRLGMGSAETRMLKDDGRSLSPTHANILESFSWLIDGAKPGDALFLHYSGHGGWVHDKNNDEEDGRDETVVPIDFQRAGQILDDEIYQCLVLEVPKGVTLTVIMDCCHSGSIFDLPFYFLQTEETNPNAPPPVMQVNPGFSWKKVFALGLQLYQMHQQGASLSQIRAVAMLEINKDPDMREGLTKAASSLLGAKLGGSLLSGGATSTSASSSSGMAAMAASMLGGGSSSTQASSSSGGMAAMAASMLGGGSNSAQASSSSSGMAAMAASMLGGGSNSAQASSSSSGMAAMAASMLGGGSNSAQASSSSSGMASMAASMLGGGSNSAQASSSSSGMAAMAASMLGGGSNTSSAAQPPSSANGLAAMASMLGGSSSSAGKPTSSGSASNLAAMASLGASLLKSANEAGSTRSAGGKSSVVGSLVSKASKWF